MKSLKEFFDETARIVSTWPKWKKMALASYASGILCKDCGHSASHHDGDHDCSGCMIDNCACKLSNREVRNEFSKFPG